MVINVYLSSLIICDIQAELNFCDIEMGDVEKIKGCKGSCQVKFFMIIVLALNIGATSYNKPFTSTCLI